MDGNDYRREEKKQNRIYIYIKGLDNQKQVECWNSGCNFSNNFKLRNALVLIYDLSGDSNNEIPKATN